MRRDPRGSSLRAAVELAHRLGIGLRRRTTEWRVSPDFARIRRQGGRRRVSRSSLPVPSRSNVAMRPSRPEDTTSTNSQRGAPHAWRVASETPGAKLILAVPVGSKRSSTTSWPAHASMSSRSARGARHRADWLTARSAPSSPGSSEWYGGGYNERAGGLPVCEELVQDGLERFDGGEVGLHEEAVLSGDAVAL